MNIKNFGQTIAEYGKKCGNKALGYGMKYGVRAAGIAGLGICLYDAHKQGLYKANLEVRKGNANAALDWFDNSRNMTQPSQFNSNVKDGLFRWELHNNFRAFVNAGIGYVKGAAQMMFCDLVPLGLSVAAIAAKGASKTSKVVGGALGLYALYGFGKNILGIGVSQDNGSNKAI